MTREEARKAAEVMLAYADGKEIQFKDDVDEVWKGCMEPLFNFDECEYRVKPEKKYRPYNSAKEFIDAQKEHGEYFVCNGLYYLPTCIDNRGVNSAGNVIVNYDYRVLLADFKWQDGSPMGILEE